VPTAADEMRVSGEVVVKASVALVSGEVVDKASVVFALRQLSARRVSAC
jgi:hypothetical protein